MKVLYIDCRYGMSGDMFVSALFDLGVDFFELQKIFKEGGISIDLKFFLEKRICVSGKVMKLFWEEKQPLRTLGDIYKVLDRVSLSDEVIQRSKRAFLRLAEVEAMIHNVDVNEVHFHEIGAIDTLWDVVASFWGLEKLGIGRIESSPVPWFEGEISFSHGNLPLPAPATVLLLQNKPVFPTKKRYEMITPTGALLLDQLVDEFKIGPEGCLVSSGIGYGHIPRDFFNGLRVFLLNKEEVTDMDNMDSDEIYVLESNIDHLTGEELGFFFESILNTGALDVIYLPGIMKKNRPGGLLQVLCRFEDLDRVMDAFFKNTLTLGIRFFTAKRKKLKREVVKELLEEDEIRIKKFKFDGETYRKIEFDDLKRLCLKTGKTPVQMRFKKD